MNDSLYAPPAVIASESGERSNPATEAARVFTDAILCVNQPGMNKTTAIELAHRAGMFAARTIGESGGDKETATNTALAAAEAVLAVYAAMLKRTYNP